MDELFILKVDEKGFEWVVYDPLFQKKRAQLGLSVTTFERALSRAFSELGEGRLIITKAPAYLVDRCF